MHAGWSTPRREQIIFLRKQNLLVITAIHDIPRFIR